MKQWVPKKELKIMITEECIIGVKKANLEDGILLIFWGGIMNGYIIRESDAEIFWWS